MRKRVDVLVIGGGIAGISAAARIARHADTVVLERESALGYHSSGRSATFYHFGIGNDCVRGMTAASSDFFASPPAEYAEGPLWTEKAALFIADQASLPQLEALHIEMDRFTSTVRRVGPQEMLGIVPVLKTGEDGIVAGLLDTGGRKLDADALLQANARAFRHAGGTIGFDSTVRAVVLDGERWNVDTRDASYSARIVVNAAGAWADEVAGMAGVRPLGLQPLRRTIIGFAPPSDLDVSGWPFLKTVSEEGFYMLPDAGLLLASPMDVTPHSPCDVQPEDYDVALAAWRVEEATTLKIARVNTRWAGLRSFVADKVPTAGFAPDRPGFFWLAGQGGYGLQTSPAMALATESLMFDLPWPDALSRQGLRAEHVRPERLYRNVGAGS
ncbi:NAD(P)/FAD-dependent oxidoreductase [Sphingomonas psychrotolerans]|uniref:FAD-dependent oxidoreductase n=1 Tax=Sphingomonas psychrotolerans TaxID=1327635 RepID=A0A2K8MLU5_9SPHN|nr:FAD-binding oxidoreductase [Sphingomonas psychrotolerans]ATY33974.1 FAD-dependent oxidoreductase [Sphingomonas psychrotolerans]